jgi:hypothetical protein
MLPHHCWRLLEAGSPLNENHRFIYFHTGSHEVGLELKTLLP